MAGTRDADACPGALRPHQAADGALARIRLPGGMITAAQLATLASVASDFGSATLELTARGNVQLRGIRDVAAVADAVAKAGLLPSATHERVRNIVASPLSGRAGGLADVRAWVGELDAAIRAEPLIEVALRFVKIRETAWRVTELADIGELQSGVELGPSVRPVTKTPVGWIPQDDSRVTLGAAVPLGVLPARVAECLAAIEAPLVITPWRSVLICDLDDATADAALRVLAPLGLVFDENSPWLNISACTGSPGCAHSAADVRADAARSLNVESAGHRHFVGCERACGSPPAGEVLVATGGGYRRLRP